MRQKMFPCRPISIKTAGTPNPSCLKFVPVDQKITGSASQTLDIGGASEAHVSPLAARLFTVSGITRVFFAKDFISVTKEDSLDWELLKPMVIQTIDSHFEQKLPLFTKEIADSTDDTKIMPGDSEALQMIKEIIATRVRPFV